MMVAFASLKKKKNIPPTLPPHPRGILTTLNKLSKITNEYYYTGRGEEVCKPTRAERPEDFFAIVAVYLNDGGSFDI